MWFVGVVITYIPLSKINAHYFKFQKIFQRSYLHISTKIAIYNFILRSFFWTDLNYPQFEFEVILYVEYFFPLKNVLKILKKNGKIFFQLVTQILIRVSTAPINSKKKLLLIYLVGRHPAQQIASAEQRCQHCILIMHVLKRLRSSTPHLLH